MKLKPGMRITNSLTQLDQDGDYDCGTLGGFVRHANSHEWLVITCLHVVWWEGMGFKINANNHQTDPLLLNVAVIDDENKKHTIGQIVRAEINERVDIALIKLNGEFEPDPEIPELGVPTGSVLFSDMDRGNIIKKYGGKTHFTMGSFYNYSDPQTFLYSRGLRPQFDLLMKLNSLDSEHFSCRGDSGSLIMKDDRVAGVLMGGIGQTTYGIQSYFIEKTFNITFDL